MKVVILGLIIVSAAAFLALMTRGYRRFLRESEPDEDEETHVRLEESNLNRYGSYSTQLLTWFSAYGAGLAATIFIKLAPHADECDLPQLRLALWLIVAGMAAQAFLVLLNKYTQWVAYTTPREQAKWTGRQKFNAWLTTVIELDILVDVVTVVLFGWATSIVIQRTGMQIVE